MKELKKKPVVKSKKLFVFEQAAGRGLATTDPTTVTIYTNTGTLVPTHIH